MSLYSGYDQVIEIKATSLSMVYLNKVFFVRVYW